MLGASARTIYKNLSGLTFEMEGDSIMAGMGSMAELKALTGISTINNRAVHGSRYVITSPTNIVLSHSSRTSLISGSSHGIVIMGGINDTGNVTDQGAMTTKIGTLNDTTNTTILGSVHVWYNAALAILGSTKPIILATPFYGQYSGATDFQYIPEFIRQVADAIKLKAAQLGIPCIDMWNNSGINASNYLTYLSDGVHPNAAGITKLSIALANGMNSLPAYRYGN